MPQRMPLRSRESDAPSVETCPRCGDAESVRALDAPDAALQCYECRRCGYVWAVAGQPREPEFG
jgi:predicted RNA-binding Zn-ribbon protein involved in translation (DUF1610 family)